MDNDWTFLLTPLVSAATIHSSASHTILHKLHKLKINNQIFTNTTPENLTEMGKMQKLFFLQVSNILYNTSHNRGCDTAAHLAQTFKLPSFCSLHTVLFLPQPLYDLLTT